MKSAARPHLVRAFRLALLTAAVLLIRHHAPSTAIQALPLDRVRDQFPSAAAISEPDAGGLQTLTDPNGQRIGFVVQTRPASDRIIGYSGPTHSLISLDPNGRVLGLRILHSDDTPEHLAEVVSHRPFFNQFKGLKLGAIDSKFRPDTVTGATLTSTAIAEGVLARLGGSGTSLRFPQPITLTEIKELLPAAAELKEDLILDAKGQLIGRALRTSPSSDAVVGYKGPSDTLMILDPAGGKIVRIKLRSSFDTSTYVGYVTGDSHFTGLFANMPMGKLAALDYAAEKIEGVSGATETSYAVAEGLKRRAQAWISDQKPAALALFEKVRWRWQDTGHLMVLFAALVMAYTRLRGIAWVRHVHHALLVVYGGFMVGEMLSQALFVGWARNGTPWRSAPGLLLLAVVALLAPVFTRRQLYCHHICPHGALQQLLSRRLPWQFQPGPRLLKILHAVPHVLLGFVFFAAVYGLAVNLNAIEPFDAYVWKVAGFGALAIFALGIIASLFIPLAYCHHGCPTGALFGFLRSSGSSDRLGRRELIATVLLILFGMVMHFRSPQSARTAHVFEGKAMGSNWSVQMAGDVDADSADLVSRRLEELEQIFSHYRPDSNLSQFNRHHAATWFPVPNELAEVVQLAKSVHQQTEGALDPTIAPLVDLWGFGPKGRRASAPSEEEVNAAKARSGLNKVQVKMEPPALFKSDAAVTLNLSAVVEGFAAREIDQLLTKNGSQNHLVNIGGEVAARGCSPDGHPWNVGIQNPSDAGICTTMALINESATTSGTYRQHFEAGGRSYSHILDPRTGRPVEHRTTSVTVIHPDPALADAYATALLVLGSGEGRAVADKLKLNALFLDGATPR